MLYCPPLIARSGACETTSVLKERVRARISGGGSQKNVERSSSGMKRSEMLSRTAVVVVLMAAFLAVGCGGGEPAPSPPAPADTPAPPTATSVPATPSSEKGNLPSRYTKYSDPSGVFSIEHPSDWPIDDRSLPGTVSIFWYPEPQYATASLFVTNLEGIPDPQARIHDLIDEWMIDASSFATDPDYEELSRQDQGDGSVLLRFYYTREDEPTQAGCLFEIQDTLFSALCLSAAEEEWDQMVQVLDHMADSYVVTPPVAERPGSSYVQYAHPSGVFSIEHPADWTVEDLSTAGQNIFISFSTEIGAFVFAQLTDAGGAMSPQDFDNYVSGVLDAGFGRAPQYQELSRTVQPNGGVLVLFSYIADGNQMNAGSLFEQRGTLVSFLTVGAPAQVFDSFTDDFDHAGNSYSVDETAWPY